MLITHCVLITQAHCQHVAYCLFTRAHWQTLCEIFIDVARPVRVSHKCVLSAQCVRLRKRIDSTCALLAFCAMHKEADQYFANYHKMRCQHIALYLLMRIVNYFRVGSASTPCNCYKCACPRVCIVSACVVHCRHIACCSKCALSIHSELY